MPEKTPSLMQWPQTHCRESLNEILEDLDNDIRDFARRKVPRNVVPSKTINFEVDELAQNTRIKLWLALQRGQITNPKAYAKCIAHTEAVDIVRKCRKFSLLLIDDYSDLDQEEIITVPSQGVQDPADEYAQKETVAACAEMIVKGVLSLPPCQQYVILCDLKNSAANIPPLTDSFLKYGLDLEAAHWPEDKDELQRLRASRSIALRKLRASLIRESTVSSSSIGFEQRR